MEINPNFVLNSSGSPPLLVILVSQKSRPHQKKKDLYDQHNVCELFFLSTLFVPHQISFLTCKIHDVIIVFKTYIQKIFRINGLIVIIVRFYPE